MKRYIIASLLLACVCFAHVATLDFTKLSSHKGDIWTIRNFKLITEYKGKHGNVATNALTIKWNIKKGRMKVRCDWLCKDDDEFFIRMFDKDTLLIADVAFNIGPDTDISGDKYIIPADVRKDIAWMEIVPLKDNWVVEIEVRCHYGYTLDTDGNTCIEEEEQICPDGYTLDTDGNTCIEEEEQICPDGYTLDTDGNTCIEVD